MRLKEFIDKYHSKEKKANTCVVCGKKFKKEEKDDIVSDHDGNLYHKECFDKETGNEELKHRRDDGGLPDGGQLPK
tara:strand:+ start:483 stop:710 length:228 start_codon:yes stop_codon:yes gene_type:complete